MCVCILMGRLSCCQSNWVVIYIYGEPSFFNRHSSAMSSFVRLYMKGEQIPYILSAPLLWLLISLSYIYRRENITAGPAKNCTCTSLSVLYVFYFLRLLSAGGDGPRPPLSAAWLEPVREPADASQDPSRSRDTHTMRIKGRKEGIGDTTHDTHTSEKGPRGYID